MSSTHKDPWTVLGVNRTATGDEVGNGRRQASRSEVRRATNLHPPPVSQIKEAYRRLCLQHHPDLCEVHRRAAAEAYFKEVTSAYQALTRRESRLSLQSGTCGVAWRG
jgi:DnaJ-class molecular chaperone